MRLLTRSLLTVSAVALAAAIAWPQSLAEIAAREKERQEKVKRKTGGAAHVITEDDLHHRVAAEPRRDRRPGEGAAREGEEEDGRRGSRHHRRRPPWPGRGDVLTAGRRFHRDALGEPLSRRLAGRR